jgi:hypothetical protein
MNAHIEQLNTLAKLIHETRIAYCWGKNRVEEKDPWPKEGEKLPGDFGYEPIPYVDIAWEQARKILVAGWTK